MKKKKIFICVCEDCGTKIEPQEKGKQWDTYPAICPKCKGKTTLKISEE